MKNKTTTKKTGCVCPFCNGEISPAVSEKITVCKPCGISFVVCKKCGEVMADSVLICPKCGEERKK